MTKQELTKLRKALPYGALNKIAIYAGISAEAVGQVFRGKFNNEKVIDEALRILKEIKEREQQRGKELNEILGK